MENLKILFWVAAIGFYIYTQLKDSFKKDDRTQPIPKMPSIPGMNTKQSASKPISVPVNSYKPMASSYQPEQKKASKRYQSKYTKAEEIRRTIEGPEKENVNIQSRAAFYKEDANPDANLTTIDDRASKFGVDEHLAPYSLNNKPKHPLMTFLSNKSNLRNAFITGEILNKKS